MFGEGASLLSATLSNGTATVVYAKALDTLKFIQKYNNVPLDGVAMCHACVHTYMRVNMHTLHTCIHTYMRTYITDISTIGLLLVMKLPSHHRSADEGGKGEDCDW